MKYLFLVWSGMWRKRTRALLILLQVTIAFTLFGVLQGLTTGIKQAINKAHANRIYVLSRVSSGDVHCRFRSYPISNGCPEWWQ